MALEMEGAMIFVTYRINSWLRDEAQQSISE
jgi:hypothetical protein